MYGMERLGIYDAFGKRVGTAIPSGSRTLIYDQYGARVGTIE